jgi:PAS domain S-box-containing protein
VTYLFGGVALATLLVNVAVAEGLIPPIFAYSSAVLIVAAVAAYLAFANRAHPLDAAVAMKGEEADPAKRQRILNTYSAGVGRSLRALYGRSCGFVLLAAPTGEVAPTVQYISNLTRNDGTELLRELLSNRALVSREHQPTVAADGALWQERLLEFTSDAVIIWEMDGAGILYWNRAAEKLYGYDRYEVRGQVTHVLLKTVPSGTVITDLEKHLARYGVWVGELQHVGRNGERIRVESRLALMSQVDGRWLVLEVNRDITDRANAERASRATERRLHDLRSRVRRA